MGFTKTSYSYSDSAVSRESNTNAIASWYWTGPGVVSYARSCITLTVDSKGVKDFSFAIPKNPSIPADARGWYWKITPTSTTSWPSSGNPCSLNSSGALCGSQDNINLTAGASYHLWIGYVYNAGASWGTFGDTWSGAMTVTGTDNVVAGDITANNANFGSAVNMSYGANLSGCQYTISVSVPTTSGTASTSTLATKTSATSYTWTPAIATYAPLITDRKSVTATISVTTYYNNTSVATKTKTVTLTLPSSVGISANNTNWITVAPSNTGAVAGKNGYIQGYSKCLLTLTKSYLTIPYSGTLSKWTVKVGSGTATDKTASTTTHTTGTLSANTSIAVTATDSRGYTVSKTLSVTVMAYNGPSVSMSYFRAVDNGSGASPRYTQSDTGTVLAITAQGSCTPLTYNNTVQNTVTLRLYTKLRTASSYTDKGTIANGTQAVFTGYGDNTYDVRVIATDSLGNTATADGVMSGAKWGLHFKNNTTDVLGAAIGKVAETDNRLDINSAWEIISGTERAAFLTQGAQGTTSGGVTTLTANSYYLLVTVSSSAAWCGAFIINTGYSLAVKLAGAANVSVSVSGANVTVTTTSGICNSFFIRLASK